MPEVEETVKGLVLNELDGLFGPYAHNLMSNDPIQLSNARRDIGNLLLMKEYVISDRFTLDELSNFLSSLNHYSGKPCA